MDDRLRSALRQHSLSETAWAVLDCIITYPIQPEREIDEIRYWLDWGGTVPSAEEVRQAFRTLREANLIQTLSERAVNEIREHVRSSQTEDAPVHLPVAGKLDLTEQGAATILDVWRLGCDRDPDEFWHVWSEKVDQNTNRFAIWTSKPWLCQRKLNEFVTIKNRVVRHKGNIQRQYICKLLSLSIPQEGGRFRDYWWRDPAEGWKMTGTYTLIIETLPANPDVYEDE
jgi:hypothetical protein